MIESNVREINKTVSGIENPSQKILAIAIEANQRFIEYLEELETSPLNICAGVTVKAEEKTIKFLSIEEIVEWITSNK